MSRKGEHVTHRPRASTDPQVLTGSAYRDDRHLAARQNLYDFQRPQRDLPGLVLEHLGDQVGTWVDVGCGNGRYLDRIRTARPDVRLVGLDLSVSLLADLTGPVVCADASRLPLRTGSALALLALHMLYHVNDPDQALSEMARVLTPDGTLIVSTNSQYDKAELDRLWSTAASTVLGGGPGPRRIKLSDNFPLEDAPHAIAAHFDDVTVVELRGVIEVESPAPVLAHFASYRSWADQAGVPFEDTLDQVGVALSKHLSAGPFRITTQQGLVVAHRPRSQ